MVLTYPEILWEATQGSALQRKRICRTFSDCTTAPRNGLPSGCFPLDSYYKESECGDQAEQGEGNRIPRFIENCPSERDLRRDHAQAIEDLIEGKSCAERCRASPPPCCHIKRMERLRSRAFQEHIVTTHRVGLLNAVNMDTGYINFLSCHTTARGAGLDPGSSGAATFLSLRAPILRMIQATLSRSIASRWMRLQTSAAFPSCFRSARLHGKSAAEKAAIYQAASHGYPHVLAFELSPVFAPNGEIFDDETFRRLLDIPEITGMKHSSLDRMLELGGCVFATSIAPSFASTPVTTSEST